MVKLKITKNEMTIIDDSECTPGQSRLYSRFREEVLQYLLLNPKAWQAVFNQLDCTFVIQSINTDPKTDETIVVFNFIG